MANFANFAMEVGPATPDWGTKPEESPGDVVRRLWAVHGADWCARLAA